MSTGEGRRFAELAGATALAVGQPLLDVFGRSTETFVFRGIDGSGYVLFALGVILAPPTLLWAAGVVIGRYTPLGRDRIHLITLAGLVGLAVLIGVRWATTTEGEVAVLLAVAAAVALMVCAGRHHQVRAFFAYLAVLPVVAFLSFVVSAPASALLGGDPAEGTRPSRDAGDERPVVMLVLDEFPTATLLDGSGAIDADRYPNFARLARETTWYRNYTTLSASTVRAVPTILTGVAPERDQQPLWTDRPDNLFTALEPSHEMRVRETVTRLCPPTICDGGTELSQAASAGDSGLIGLARDSIDVWGQLIDPRSDPTVAIDAFEEQLVSLDPIASATEVDGGAAVQPTRFADFVDDLVAAEEPVLHFLHLILPHGPWRFMPDGTEYESPELDPPGLIGGIWAEAEAAELGAFRVELQARYTDLLMGSVIERLEATGLWDQATIVIVSDHGGSFLDGERGRALTDENAFEVMWTPMFVRSPDLEPGFTDVNAQAIDVLPTVAELAGTTVPFPTDGRALVVESGGGFVPIDGAGGATGVKSYVRFTNAFQPGDDAVLDIEINKELPRLLAAGEDASESEAGDPIGTFHRDSPHGRLYEKATTAVDIGEPLAATIHLADLDQIERGWDDDPVPAYVDGWVDGDLGRAADEAWVVIALDGEVAAFSPLFAGAEHELTIGTLIDPDRLDPAGSDVTAYIATGPGRPLRPVDVT